MRFDRGTDIDAMLITGVVAFFAMAVQLRGAYIAFTVGIVCLSYFILRSYVDGKANRGVFISMHSVSSI